MLAVATDAQLRNVVAGIRGLGIAGFRPAAVAPRRSAAGLWSRHTSERVVVRHDPDALATALIRLAARVGRIAVYPGQEATIDALLAARERLPEDVVLPYGSVDGLVRLRDKRALSQLAREAGLATPATVMEAAAGELLDARLPLPCVVKPALPGGGALATATVVADRRELEGLVARLPADEQLLVQERVRGPLTAVAVVLDREGAVVARFHQQASRTWPVQAGISRLARSVAPDESLTARAAELLRLAGHSGLAQLQFVDTAAGPSLIDVNPRFYGSLPLALAAGVNLPAAWHASVTGAEAPRDDGYRVGVGYRWLIGDVLAARHGDRRALLRRAPAPRTGAAWRADDPLPGILLAAEFAALSAGKRLLRGGR